MRKNDNIVIFKNDRIGDLITSIPAINLLIKSNQDKKITIYLSQINYKMKFLLEKGNIKIIVVNYKLNLMNRINILFYLFSNNISKVFIIRPKKFYFIMPLIFFFTKIKFYGLCINAQNNYRRPNEFLRKFLDNYVINDRDTCSSRLSRAELQLNLVSNKWSIEDLTNNYNFKISHDLKKILPKDYCLIHYKHLMFENLKWGKDGLNIIINELLKYYSNVVLINDIDKPEDNLFFKKKYDWYDFKKKIFNITNNNILYLENIDGIDMLNSIKFSKKTVSCHGTITLLGNLIGTPILDLFYCEIRNQKDYHRYKNSFHEHVPKNNYDFIIPKKDIYKTIKKMKFSFKYE